MPEEQEKMKGGGMAFLIGTVILGAVLLYFGVIELPNLTDSSSDSSNAQSDNEENKTSKGVPEGMKACPTNNRDKKQVEACKNAKNYAAEKVNGKDQLQCLDQLWIGESNWNAWAENPDSSAYGIPQVLPEVHGHPFNMGDWKAQVKWGLAYIKGRYGSPCDAWNFWQAQHPHWY